MSKYFVNSALTFLLLLVLLFLVILYATNSMRKNVESFVNPLVYNASDRIGEYDGLVLKSGSKDYPFLSPSNAYTNTYQGFSAPLTNQLTNVMDVGNDAPHVDGKDTSPRDLFMFAHNQCKPECCPSAFSCSGGCVCVTKNQKRLMSYRGNNSTYCNSTYVPTNGNPVGMFGNVDEF